MEIIFTNLSTTKVANFKNVKPSGFTFEEEGCTMKLISAPGTNSYASNGTIEDAVGTIAGAINEAPTSERHRLLLELEIINDYFKNNKGISDFVDKILIKIGDRDDWGE